MHHAEPHCSATYNNRHIKQISFTHTISSNKFNYEHYAFHNQTPAIISVTAETNYSDPNTGKNQGIVSKFDSKHSGFFSVVLAIFKLQQNCNISAVTLMSA